MPPPAEAAPTLNLAAVDTTACPSESGPNPTPRENPLEPPEADDELEDNPPTIAEVASSESVEAQAAAPNANLKPTLRTPNDAAFDAPAAADADTANVELGLRWCVVERTASGGYDWSDYDARFNVYLAEGVGFRTLRIVDAPVWVVGDGCPERAQDPRTGVKMCPSRNDEPADNALRDFARDVAQRYGPNSPYDIERFSFWNEPNIPGNWGAQFRGGNAGDSARARRYSDRLKVFSTGAMQARPTIKIDAGEVAAGGPSGDNGARYWAKEFTDYNFEQHRELRYDALTIHAYSEFSGQIPKRVENYRALKGDHAVGVTEFGWSVGSGGWKCVGSEDAQRVRFNDTVSAVRDADFGVHRLVWFSAIDNRKGSQVKCPSTAYDSAVRGRMNTFGLYRRPSDGSLPSFAATTPRLLAAAFRNRQTLP